jgi:hypothetical protein
MIPSCEPPPSPAPSDRARRAQRDLEWRNCGSYSTSDETIENCFARPRDLWLDPGEAMGTAGMSLELGYMGYDVGLMDVRVNHAHAASWRYPLAAFHAVCPWEYYDAASRATLFGKLRYPSRPDVLPKGEPGCGTLEVDVVSTARGVWVSPEVTTPVEGDGLIYCYGPPVAHVSDASWLLSLSPDRTLTMERVPHTPGASPCADPPASWSFGAGARASMR